MGNLKTHSIGRSILAAAIVASATAPQLGWAMSPGRAPSTPASAASPSSPSSSGSSSSSVPTPSAPSTKLDSRHYRAIVFGGSCEEGQATNDFHDSFITVSQNLNNTGWDVRPLFAGDSAHCSVASTDATCQGKTPAADCCPAGVDLTEWSVDSIAEAAGKDPSTVGRASKKALLASLEQAATELASGDELLLVINTHGYGEQAKGQTDWDHGICVSSDEPHGTVANLDPASGQMNSVNKEGLMYMSDPDLQQSLKKLAAAGVKMGFLDDSCYGGGSIPQLETYGCTMSSTTSQLVNFESGDTSTNALGSQESNNGIAYNLPDLLQTDSNTLASQSLHGNELTMEELWLRVLARSKIAGAPEFSGFMNDASTAEQLGNWLNTINGDITYRRGDTPFTTTPTKDVITPAPLIDYAQTYLSQTVDAATLATDADLVSQYWNAPGIPATFDQGTSKTLPQLESIINGQPAQWASLVAQYNALTSQESSILANLATLNINVTWDLSGTLAGSQDLLTAVLPTMSQQGVFTYKVSQNGSPWIEVGDNFVTPDSSDFAGSTQVAANSIAYFMNAYKLSHDAYLTGLSDGFADAFSAMIIQEETQAWSLAPLATQIQMTSDFQQLKTLRSEETALINQVIVNTTGYLTQARLYSYLEYRKQAGAADQKLNQCGDFVLKKY